MPFAGYKDWEACKADGNSDELCGYLKNKTEKAKLAQLKLKVISYKLANMDTGLTSITEGTADNYHYNKSKDIKRKKQKQIPKVGKTFISDGIMKLASMEADGKHAKYWILNAKDINGNGWGVDPSTIDKNIQSFVGQPFVVTAKTWIPNSEYEDQYDHPGINSDNLPLLLKYQEKFRVGNIDEIIKDKNGDYFARIAILDKYRHLPLPPFCSPAVFQLNPHEPEGRIMTWMGVHLAGLLENPAYGPRVAILRGVCLGTPGQCSHQFKGAKIKTAFNEEHDESGRFSGYCETCGRGSRGGLKKEVAESWMNDHGKETKHFKLKLYEGKVKTAEDKWKCPVCGKELDKVFKSNHEQEHIRDYNRTDGTLDDEKPKKTEVKVEVKSGNLNKTGCGCHIMDRKAIKLAVQLERVKQKLPPVMQLKILEGKLKKAFEEGKHPRDKGGEFTTKGGEGAGGSEGESGGKTNKEGKPKNTMKLPSKEEKQPNAWGVDPDRAEELDKREKPKKENKMYTHRDKIKAIEDHLDGKVKDVVDGDSRGTVVTMEDDSEYLVYDNYDDAKEAAVQQVKDSFGEMGAEGFNKDFIDNYYTFDDEPMKREIALEQGEADRERIEEEANDENLTGKDRDEFIEAGVDKVVEETTDRLNDDPMEYFTEMGYEPEEARKKFFSIDIDTMAEDAIEADGVGHFLSGYDGEEIELKDGKFAYRTN